MPSPASPTRQANTFLYEGLRVRFQDVDHAGIVFFAKIYEYCHVAYEEFIEQVVGLPPQAFFEAKRLGAPLVATRSEHFVPLFHGDHMRIECSVFQLGRSSMTMGYAIRNPDNALCARVEMKHAFVTTEGGFRSIPIPEDIRERLLPFYSPQEPSA